MGITPRMLWNPKIWNIQYDLGSFYYRSKLNEWCEGRATHDNVAGPDPDLFLDLSGETDGGDLLTSERSNDLHDFIEETWDELKSRQNELGLSDEELYFAVESISCKFHRENGLNSCYDPEDEVMANGQYETCDSRDIYSASDVTLDEMLNFGGVSENECLRKRRSQLYSLSGSELFDESIALRLCNGEYDYFCPEWKHQEADNVKQTVQQNLNRNRHEFQFDSSDSFNYAMSSFAVMGLFIGCFLIKAMCCRKEKELMEQIPLEDEEEIYGTF